MNYRQLGDSDLKVSEISLGSWLTYGVGIERDRAEACVRQAFEEGINFIDTANVYGRGAAETFLGEVLKDVDRSSYILATKLFFPMSKTDKGLSREQVHKQVDASLQRLQTDYVDLYQCHRYDDDIPLEETMAALGEVVAQGKVRYIGLSEWSPDQIQAAVDLPDVTPFVSSQPQYSMIWRRPEAKVIPLCAKNGIGQIVWSPLGQGVLTGKYKPGEKPAADTRATNDQMNAFIGRWLEPPMLEAVDGLTSVAKEAGMTMAQMALAWVLREPNVSSAIVGASRPEQVTDNAAASGKKLSDDVLSAIDAALSEVVSGA